MTPPETAALTGLLGELRGDVQGLGRDLGEIKTSCAVLVERSDRTERDVRDLERALAAERQARAAKIAAVRADLEDLKRARWKAAGWAAGAATALAVPAGYLAQALGG